MKNLKILFTSLIITGATTSLVHTPAYANKHETKRVELHTQIKGMNENDVGAKARSKIFGLSVREISYPDEALKAMKVDEKLMAQDINETIDHAGRYFKQNPQLQGIFLIKFSFFPGYKYPFQFSDSLVKENKISKEEFYQLNKFIYENSNCNKEDFCSALVLNSFKYIDEDSKDEFNQSEFDQHMTLQKSTTDKLQYQPTVKDKLKPVNIDILLSANGKIISKEEATKALKGF